MRARTAVMSAAWIDGRAATAEDLRALALVNYGHFTTMQVRGRAVQGLDLHLQRLQDATAELFGCDLDPQRVRTDIRRALAAQGVADATVRVTVFARDFDPRNPAVPVAATDVLVSIALPAAPAADPLHVMSCRYARVLPHIKHVGTFPLFHHRRLAVQAGFDDVLFVDADGRVSEGSLWNIGFWDGHDVLWPQAPALRGTCERLLQTGLAQLCVGQATRPIRREDLSGFAGAFTANARGVQAIARIDDVAWTPDPGLAALLAQALDSHPWQLL